MKPTHLITLSARVEEINKAQEKILNKNEELNRLWKPLISLCWRGAFDLIVYWESFIKQIVTLAHFVPCDANGVPLKDKAKRKCTQSQCIIHDACGACSCSVDYQQELNEAQKSVIFEGWEVFSAVEVRNKNDDRLNFRNGNVFYDIHDGDGGYIGKYLPDNPSLADLAEATTENPLKLK